MDIRITHKEAAKQFGRGNSQGMASIIRSDRKGFRGKRFFVVSVSEDRLTCDHVSEGDYGEDVLAHDPIEIFASEIVDWKYKRPPFTRRISPPAGG